VRYMNGRMHGLHESDACWLSASGWRGVLIHPSRIHSITLMLSMKAIIIAMAYHACEVNGRYRCSIARSPSRLP
jgi:hypothetical protein